SSGMPLRDEYWHIGDTTTRLRSDSAPRRNGSINFTATPRNGRDNGVYLGALPSSANPGLRMASCRHVMAFTGQIAALGALCSTPRKRHPVRKARSGLVVAPGRLAGLASREPFAVHLSDRTPPFKIKRLDPSAWS